MVRQHCMSSPWANHPRSVQRHLLSGLLLCLLSAPSLAQTTIYRIVDENGEVTFTDQPPQGTEQAEQIQLRELNSAPPPVINPRRNPTPNDTPPAPPPRSVRIDSPADESTIAMGPGDFTVRASAEPPLRRLEALQLLMDETPIGAPQRETVWQLSGVLRGPHDLVVQRLSANGEVNASSPPVRVYVLRPSLNQPQRPR